MKKPLLLILVFSYALAFSQVNEPNQHRGKIIKADGSTEEGVIEANLNNPWSVQKEIRLFDPKLLESGARIKNKDKKEYGPKDIAGFTFDDRLFESHKFADMSAVGAASLGAMYFLEVIKNGKIKLFKFYNSPPTVVSGQSFEEVEAEIRNNPRFLIKKGDEKVKEIQVADLPKYINDCPEVYEKFKKGEYGNQPVDEDKTKAGKLISKALDSTPITVMFTVVEEYNEAMKGK